MGALLALLGVSPAAAQDVQVPLDRDSTLYVLDADLRRKVELFPEVSGFREARLYRTEKAEYELVIRYEQNGRILRERRSLTPAEVKELRTRITEGLAAANRLSPGAQEGRYGLIAATTFHGLVEGGLLAGAFGVEGSSAGTLTLLGGATGFFVPLLATRNSPVSEAEADMVFYGGLQGYAHAVELMGVLAGEGLPGAGSLASAQESPHPTGDTTQRYGWVNGGIGAGRTGIGITAAAGVPVKGAFFIGGRYARTMELLLFTSPAPMTWDAGPLVGLVKQGRYGHLSLASGIVVVGGRRLVGEAESTTGCIFCTTEYESTHYSTLGIPLDVQAFFTPIRYVGIGIHGYANVNTRDNMLGWSVQLQVRLPQ